MPPLFPVDVKKALKKPYELLVLEKTEELQMTTGRQ